MGIRLLGFVLALILGGHDVQAQLTAAECGVVMAELIHVRLHF